MSTRKQSPEARQLLREHHCCELCGDTRNLEVHHIIPVVCGGSNDINNLIVICGACHAKLTPKNELIKLGIQKAHADGVKSGREPIIIDDEKFGIEVRKWKDGCQTARATMKNLGLKPTTFYKKVKELNTNVDQRNNGRGLY